MVACGAGAAAVSQRDSIAIIRTGITCAHVFKVPGRRCVSLICLGPNHAAVLTNCGALFTWGSGMHGALGHGNSSDINRPTRVKRLAGVAVSSVSCGNNHTVASTRSGEVFTWGSGWHGQLGMGCVIVYVHVFSDLDWKRRMM